jgi:hypothetical protein
MLVYPSIKNHFSLEKVYSVESMREGTLFPVERVYNVHVLSVEKHFSLWKVYSVESMREELYSLLSEYACSFSLEAFFPLEGLLQCGVYERRSSIPW